MEKVTKFQFIVTGIFAAFVVLGVIAFSLYKSGGGSVPTVSVTVWGTMREGDFNSMVQASGVEGDKTVAVIYVKKEDSMFDRELLEAIASRRGPDLIVLPHEEIYRQRERLNHIPYTSYSERLFKDTFVEGSEIFLTNQGILALPLYVDPLVMYWNRDLFTNAGLSQPPRYWDEFFALTQRLTKRDGALNIRQSALAFGEYNNVNNAKEILSALIIQAGNPITEPNGNSYESVFTNKVGSISPAEAALNYYTEFSNPSKSFYSWNRSLPSSLTFFLSGDLGVYFGYASEIFDIQAKNPNLNFDVAYLPQLREARRKTTYGRIQGLAVMSSSSNIPSAVSVVYALTGWQSVASLTSINKMPPSRRDLHATKPTNPYLITFYESALFAKAWVDPDKEKSSLIFKEMIESVTSGRARTSEAVSKAGNEIQNLLK